MPLGQTNTPRIEGRGIRSFAVIARLADGVTLEQARAEITNIARATARDYPESNRDLMPDVLPYQELATGPQTSLTYWSLLGASLLVLLIACVNVANLLLARSVRRTREIGIRVALGANRWRIVQQLLVESVSIAAIGGVLSVPLVMGGVRLLDRMTRMPGARTTSRTRSTRRSLPSSPPSASPSASDLDSSPHGTRRAPMPMSVSRTRPVRRVAPVTSSAGCR